MYNSLFQKENFLKPFLVSAMLVFSLTMAMYPHSAIAQVTPSVEVTPAADGTKEIPLHNTTGYACVTIDLEWHFVITSIDTEAHAPASIQVTWANGDTEPVLLSKYVGGVAHYSTTLNLDSSVVSATAIIYSDWDVEKNGNFNLSHGPCNSVTPSVSPTPTVTPEVTVTPEPTNTPVPTATLTPGPTATPGPGPTNTPGPTATPTPGSNNGEVAGAKSDPAKSNTEQGEVLGATTLANTGTFSDTMMNMALLTGIALFAVGAKRYVKEQK